MTRLPVDVEGDLHVGLPGGRRARLRARGAGLQLSTARWRDLLRLRRGLRGSGREGSVVRALHTADLETRLCVRGFRVASLARTVGPEPPRWRVHPGGALRTLFKRAASFRDED